MNGREGFATAANKCCKVLKGRGQGVPQGQVCLQQLKIAQISGGHYCQPAGMLGGSGQALPHHCAGQTAPNPPSCCFLGWPPPAFPAQGAKLHSPGLFLVSTVMFPAQGMQGKLQFSPRMSQELHQLTSSWGFPWEKRPQKSKPLLQTCSTLREFHTNICSLVTHGSLGFGLIRGSS